MLYSFGIGSVFLFAIQLISCIPNTPTLTLEEEPISFLYWSKKDIHAPADVIHNDRL